MTKTRDMAEILADVERGLIAEAKARLEYAKLYAEIEEGEHGAASAAHATLRDLWCTITGEDERCAPAIADLPDPSDLPQPFDNALAVTRRGYCTFGDDWICDSVRVELATGGPGYWLDWDGTIATLAGAWWGDAAECTIWDDDACAMFGAALDEMLD